MPDSTDRLRRVALASTAAAAAVAPTASAQSPADRGGSSLPALGVPRPLFDVGGRAALADTDGDGDFDLYLSRSPRSVAEPFLFSENTGTPEVPAFAPPAPVPLPPPPEGSFSVDLAFGDLDNDGDLDLLTSYTDAAFDYGYQYAENVGTAQDPEFVGAPLPSGLTPSQFAATSVAFADLDGDGDLDLVEALYDPDDYETLVRYQENVGTPEAPSFGPAQIDPFGIDGVPLDPNGGLERDNTIGIGDLDGDGDFDILRGTFSGYLLVNENTGTPTQPAFGAATFGFEALGVPLQDFGTAPTLADLDGDGLDDLVLGFADDVRLATGEPPVANPLGLTHSPLGPTPALADFDGDGDLDVLAGQNNCLPDYAPNTCSFLVVTGSDDVLLYYENTGTPLAADFAAPVVNPFGFSPIGEDDAISAVDLDGDGDFDLLIGNKNPGLYFQENTGTPQTPDFSTPAVSNPFGLAPASDNLRPAAGDLDGDGDSDVLTVQETGEVAVYENTGTPQAPAFASGVNPNVGPFPDGFPTLHDTDGDGDADLFVGLGDGSVAAFENTTAPDGPITFASADPPPEAFPLGSSARPAIGDLTGDGEPDLLVGLIGGDWVLFDGPLAPVGLAGTLTPTGPTTFPASGGTLAYSASLTNNTDTATTVQAEVVAVLPSGRERSLFSTSATLGPGKTVSRAFTEPVPARAPAGTYTLRLDANGATLHSFQFEKQGVSQALMAEAQDASVLLSWAGSGRYEVQRLIGETGLYDVLGTVDGEGTLRFRTPPLAAGAHRFRVRPLGEGADLWDEAAEAEVVVGLDGTHRMSPVSPNPFGANGATFTLAVAEGQPVEVGVYDALGREVARLHEGPLAATQAHRFSLDARGLAPGVYVVRVSGRDFAEARSVTLLR